MSRVYHVIDLLMMPLEGCQVVLGAQWMKQLGDASLNFAKLQFLFIMVINIFGRELRMQ